MGKTVRTWLGGFRLFYQCFISIFCVNNLSAESQLFMIIVVLFFARYFLYYISLIITMSIIAKAELILLTLHSKLA